MNENGTFIALLIAQFAIYIGICYIAPKDKKIGKVAFFWTVLVVTLLPALDYIFVRPLASSGVAEIYGLVKILAYTVVTPMVTAIAFKFRVNDAGIDGGAAYLGIIPTISLFAAIYLLFQDKAYATGEPGH